MKGDSAKILVKSLVFSKWARHRGDVGTKTGSAPVSGEFRGGSCHHGENWMSELNARSTINHLFGMESSTQYD
ncbi:hypothetical protein Prudu_022437 [Prunus dulcis]|uniref:Uncharacterized protein n=1 Tax=Prunus dulcis TaxID=3755 RepID=A0A4Y1S1F5_PRUDU|nr:hypothetical protein Prudu_022437 [Prunus dulcis]